MRLRNRYPALSVLMNDDGIEFTRACGPVWYISRLQLLDQQLVQPVQTINQNSLD